MAATEPIRNKGQLKALANYFLKRGQFRNYALIIVGTSTAPAETEMDRRL